MRKYPWLCHLPETAALPLQCSRVWRPTTYRSYCTRSVRWAWHIPSESIHALKTRKTFVTAAYYHVREACVLDIETFQDAFMFSVETMMTIG